MAKGSSSIDSATNDPDWPEPTHQILAFITFRVGCNDELISLAAKTLDLIIIYQIYQTSFKIRYFTLI